VTQISSVRLKTDGSGIISSDDEKKPWRTALETRFAQAEPNPSASRQGLIPDDVLVYMSKPVTADTEVWGPIRVTL